MANPVDQIVAKTLGIAHEVKARMDGLTGVFKVLAEQHGEASALLSRAKADPAKRPELWPMIRASLKAHEQGELREVYPAMREYSELRAFADRHDLEASELSATIDQMDASDPRSGQFATLLDKLIGLIEAHVEEEEKQIFPTSLKVMGDARAAEIEPKFVATAKAIKKTELTTTKH